MSAVFSAAVDKEFVVTAIPNKMSSHLTLKSIQKWLNKKIQHLYQSLSFQVAATPAATNNTLNALMTLHLIGRKKRGKDNRLITG